MKLEIKNATLYPLAILTKIYAACIAYVFLEWVFFCHQAINVELLYDY